MSLAENGLDTVKKIVELLFEEKSFENPREKEVCKFQYPMDLSSKVEGLEISEEPADQDVLVNMCRTILRYSVNTAHPRFFNQLYGGLDHNGIAGAWMSETLNSSMYTYEVAPVFTLMEKHIMEKMMDYIGFTGGDVIMAPGGSISNLYGINLARYHKFPEVKSRGLQAIPKPLCLFASEKAHYSIPKAAEVLGLGTQNVILVKSDDKGKMSLSDLNNKINTASQQGMEPFLVVATAGTTVLGAYDPIDELADICQSRGLWLHVDGAWGGSVALSKKYKHLIKGIEKADSMTWNAHKMMGVSQQCSFFLTKHKGLLRKCNCANAQYLFQNDKNYDVAYDTGDMSIQCGRKNDILKLWMVWKSQGDLGLERRVDHLFHLSEYLAEKIKQTEGFRLIQEPECTNVCFYYIPKSMRGQPETAEWWKKIAQVAPVIKGRMMEQGTMMVTYTPDGDRPNFFRMVTANYKSTTDDMDFVVAEIDRLGQDL